MNSKYALIAAALLASTVAACTEDLEPIDDEVEVLPVAKNAANGDLAAVDTLDTTSCPATKVLICHIPPGNPDNMHAICVSEWAVPAHQTQHGASVGACAARAIAPPPPVCRSLGAECSQDVDCCSGACAWDECIDHI